MKYENAKDILPEKLLAEVQRYASGKLLYIPKIETAKKWGEVSGYREQLKKRNIKICNMYSSGKSILEIAEEFFLSPETVKKLVYGKRVDLPLFEATIESATKYDIAGMGEEWIRTFLVENDIDMPDMMCMSVTNLVRMPLRLIDQEAIIVDEQNINDQENVPLIVLFRNHKFVVPYQKRKLISLKQEGRNSFPVFIFIKNEDYSFFWNNYGRYFQR